MEQRAPWKSSRWNRVQDYGRIERGIGSISFIMHHHGKPVAVFLASQSCSEGGESWCRVRGLDNYSNQSSKLTPNNQIPLGSVTKFFSAVLVLRLVETGKLKLDEPIAPTLQNSGGYQLSLINNFIRP